MKKVSVVGPTNAIIMRAVTDSILYGLKLPSVMLKSTTKKQTSYDVVLEKIDFSIWNLPQSHFNNEPEQKRYLILDGWINSEKGEKSFSSVVRKCRLEIHDDGTILLQKKRNK